MCDKTTERFKRPSFSVIIKGREGHQSFATKNKTSQDTLIMNNTCGLGPKVYDIEKTPVFFAAAGEGGIVSPHAGSWEDVWLL